jgi:tetratricopeptide (TPR) repeat protein
MIAPLFALALLGGFSPAVQQKPVIEINVNVKDGEEIRGVRHFRVTVNSKNPVTQVEFWVGSDLRDNDTSTPYEFKIDTLEEDDGPLKLRFIAYTTEGEKAERAVAPVVDNGLGKGADYHVERGLEHLRLSKWDDALLSGRIALKAKPGHNQARLLMARAYYGKGIMDTAQKYAEDAVEADEELTEGRELLAAINLQRALHTFHREGERTETISLIRGALSSAVDARRANLERQLKALTPVTDENRIAYADVALQAGRYSAVISELAPVFQKQIDNNAVANRLAYAYLRSGRVADAFNVLRQLEKYGSLDAYSYALLAIVHQEVGDTAASDAAMREAVLSDREDLGVRTAQAYIALKRARANVLQNIATDLAREEGQRTEVNFYLAALNHHLRRYDESRRYFERTLMAEPMNYDMYIERANEILMLVFERRTEGDERTHQQEMAHALFDAALTARPEAFQALTGKAIVFLLQGKNEDALRFAQAASAAGPQYAAAHFALSAAYNANRMTVEASNSLRRAEQLDKVVLEGRQVPAAMQAWDYFARFGRTPLITPPRLQVVGQ